MIIKIISGGQTGADIAALKFAKDNGIPTGGYISKGYLTEEGSKPELKDLYGLQEVEAETYRERTIRNVRESDGTVIFAVKMSKGSELTKNTCRLEKKPFLINPTIDRFREWIKKNDIKVLNVAGNRESISPGIEQRVYIYLQKALLPP